MRWLRTLFGTGPRAGDAGGRRGVAARCTHAPSDAGGAGADDAASRAILGAEETQHPFDLRADLDAAIEPSPAQGTERLAERVLGLAPDAERWAERPLLAALAGRLRRDELRLPSMPQTVLRVQRLLDTGQASVVELASEIERDPALATRLVGIANSPFYRGLGGVQSLSDAIVRIGLGETRNIVLAVALRSRVFRVPGHEAEVERLWSHSVAASVAAQVIGARVGADPDAAFLAGLLHDLGSVVLLASIGEIECASRGRLRLGDTLHDRLNQAVHAELGAHVAAAWRIEASLVAAIAEHHDDWVDSASRMTRVVRCADLMAHRVRPGPRPEATWAGALVSLGLEGSAGDLEEEIRDALRSRESASRI
jgi:putative nucleotidyltransferase with HDIG domain